MAEIPFKVAYASRSFHKDRSSYYKYLGLMLKGGKNKPRKLFEDDIERYAGKPRGVLSEHWLDANITEGGKLADSFQGTLPDDELAILRVSEESGGDALVSALADVSRMAKLADTIKSQVITTLLVGFVAILLATMMWTVLPIIAVKNAKRGFANVPLEYWGGAGRSLLNYANFVEGYWYIVILLLAGVIFAIYWSLGNLVGPTRDWLDRNLALYRVGRDIRAALFMSTMSMLTRKRGNVMFTLEQGLQKFLDSARSPWMRWRIEQILDRGGAGAEPFRTGLLPDEMFYFLEDMEKASGISQAFSDTRDFVEEILLEKIIAQMTFYKWLMLVGAVVLGGTMFIWNIAVVNELRSAMGTVSAMSQ